MRVIQIYVTGNKQVDDCLLDRISRKWVRRHANVAAFVIGIRINQEERAENGVFSIFGAYHCSWSGQNGSRRIGVVPFDIYGARAADIARYRVRAPILDIHCLLSDGVDCKRSCKMEQKKVV